MSEDFSEESWTLKASPTIGGDLYVIRNKSEMVGLVYGGLELFPERAALVAAAPDLLNALEQLLDDMGDTGHCVCPAAKKMALEALKKAMTPYTAETAPSES